MAYTTDECVWLIFETLILDESTKFFYSQCWSHHFKKDLSDCPYPVKIIHKGWGVSKKIACFVPKIMIMNHIYSMHTVWNNHDPLNHYVLSKHPKYTWAYYYYYRSGFHFTRFELTFGPIRSLDTTPI